MRTKSVSRFDAGLICSLRIEQARNGIVLPLSEFADQMLRDNNLAKPIRRQTLWRILTGRYYPELNFEGEPIDFSQMPNACRGVSEESQLEHDIRDLKSGWHQLRHELRDARADIYNELEALKARIAALEEAAAR